MYPDYEDIFTILEDYHKFVSDLFQQQINKSIMAESEIGSLENNPFANQFYDRDVEDLHQLLDDEDDVVDPTLG